MAVPCQVCGCTLTTADSLMSHALLAALAVDDLDRALASGLLDSSACAGCSDGCNTQLIAVRDARRDALAARERYRARTSRLQRRTSERTAKRASATPSTETAKALPAAAAAALARAKAKAAERGSR